MEGIEYAVRQVHALNAELIATQREAAATAEAVTRSTRESMMMLNTVLLLASRTATAIGGTVGQVITMVVGLAHSVTAMTKSLGMLAAATGPAGYIRGTVMIAVSAMTMLSIIEQANAARVAAARQEAAAKRMLEVL